MSPLLDSDSPPFLESASVGAAAWLFGYVFTYLLVATDLESSPLNRLIEAFDGRSVTYELVGWVFYNAHLVDISYTGISIFTPPRSFIGGDGGFTALLYLVPPALLLVAGLALGRYRGVTEPTGGAITGALVVPGYLVLSVAGVFLFTVSVGGASGAPELLPAVLLAGLVYPAVFGSIGGVLAAVTSDR
ncbi:hypothetical protein KM295_10010 [Natronomonas sp. F2-12]|jgi:hypothetical protein|uniref:DUF7978 domain-containing protein n=1 Tax=Natronomonas aquatica TaxID=2841590 RepID=A0A9R1D4X6_9EURY|nr:hypothetical protein [Natronomonas aquatica]MCQ4333809.1 hypothetical protein [Natronomonas aquatica]